MPDEYRRTSQIYPNMEVIMDIDTPDDMAKFQFLKEYFTY